MTKETKSNAIELFYACVVFAFIIAAFAFGQKYINATKAKFIQHTEVNGQGK
jgi:hypothetical protein